MVYVSLCITVAFFSVISIVYNLKMKGLAFLFFSIITIMSMFRYGSGTDYFSYMMYYEINPSNITDSINMDSHVDIGYRIIMAISKSFGLKFEVFIAIVTLFIMLVYIISIYKNSEMPMVSLLVFMGLYYGIYVNSGIRQGIAMAIFLIAFLRYYKKRKLFRYIFLIYIGSFFHECVYIALIIPLIGLLYKKRFNDLKFNISLFIVSIVFLGLNISSVIVHVFALSYEITGPSIMAILLRLLMLAIMIVIYECSEKEHISSFDKKCIYIYFINVLIFISVCNIPILSRLTDCITIIDIFIFGNMCKKIKYKKDRFVISIVLSCVLLVVFCKDQKSFLVEGDYYNKNLLNYPYVSVFNKWDIYNYRMDKFKGILDY